MEFVAGCALFGIGAVILMAVGSDIFLSMRDRRNEKKLDASNWR